MPLQATPAYLGHNFQDASPGLRFGLYLAPIWQSSAREQKKDPKGQEKAWQIAKRLNPGDMHRMKALAERQNALAGVVAPTDQLLLLDSKSVSPFTTGLGNEHPLENGFAFLNPYGLPYLPGSGTKGVLRQAARELAGINAGEKWGAESEWNSEAIDALFGREDSKDARRGALQFWDVIPQINGDSLLLEVMTPHQTHYYQKGETPHESGQPNPIKFLTIPPGSEFTFPVVCDIPFLARIAPTLAEGDYWKSLLREAFEHAFDWLGFGAKTAVGYGAMEINQHAEDARAEQAKQLAFEKLSPEQKLLENLRSSFENEKAANQLQGGCHTAELRLKVLRAAVEWEAGLRHQAAELIDLITQHLPWSKKQKKQGVAEQVAQLRK